MIVQTLFKFLESCFQLLFVFFPLFFQSFLVLFDEIFEFVGSSLSLDNHSFYIKYICGQISMGSNGRCLCSLIVIV